MHFPTTALCVAALSAFGLSTAIVDAACPSAVTGSLPAPSVASGFGSRLLLNGLTTPRGMIFDSAGHLLVVQRGKGVTAVTLKDNGNNCLSVASQKTVLSDTTLNHGIALSVDGKTLFASSSESAFSYPYNPTTATATTPGKTIVTNMTNTDHTTRTLTTSQKLPGAILISRGSSSNIDPDSSNILSGHGQVKVFNANPAAALDFVKAGKLLGWGLRNDVGVAEHPNTGGIWSVENSLDNIERDGVDFHQNNPAEELNYLGTLVNNTSPNQGKNFGYPACVAAWIAKAVPDAKNLQAGQQFAVAPDSSMNDAYCLKTPVAPRLVFTAHMAPLDIKFNKAGTEAWVSFHGSFDRTVPQGYKVSRIAFENGVPTAPSTSHTALEDIVKNHNTTACPTNCFRPVGLAFDNAGRLFFSSDASGEIYYIYAA